MSKDVEITIEAWARSMDIPPNIALAVAMQESSHHWVAERHEPQYRYMWDIKENAPFRKLHDNEIAGAAPKDFPGGNDEWVCQKTSWGPMQIMGAVARELGFKGNLRHLNGRIGVEYGTIHLNKLRHRFFDDGGWPAVISAYNAGSPRKNGRKYVNQQYVDKVLAYADQFNTAHP